MAIGLAKHNVSVFVSVEFADEALLNLLATYGELNLHPFAASSLPKKAILTLRTAFVSFNSTRLTVIFQSVWSLGSLKIGFKYLGHPVTPHHCQSTKHVVKNCPKRCQPPPPPRPAESDPSEQGMDTSTLGLFTQPGTKSYTSAASDSFERPHATRGRRGNGCLTAPRAANVRSPPPPGTKKTREPP